MSTDDDFPASAKHAEMRGNAWKIGVRFNAKFTFALILLVVSLVLAIRNSEESAAARQTVSHTDDVIECVAELGEHAISRELAFSNFLRTGDAGSRKQYELLDKETLRLGEKLITLVADTPAQLQRADRLKKLMDDRSRVLAALISKNAPADSARVLAANVLPSATLLSAMEDAKHLLGEEELSLLGEGQAPLDPFTDIVERLTPMIGVIGLLALLGCHFDVRRYVRQTRDAEARADAARQVAQDAGEFKNAFLANVSHEIRSPLAAILGYADMLCSEEVWGGNDRDECLAAIRRSGEHLLTIVNDILDLSKIEAGRMSTELIPCGIVEILSEIASIFRRVAADRGLFFEVKYIDAIPERIRTDPTRIRQVLMNLVGNAVKFTERGGVRLLVDFVNAPPAPPMLRVRVIDTGIGMEGEVIDKLFRPFTQGDISMTRRFGGTGLGLTISRQFAELLGGTIGVESEAGRGSTFTLTVATGDLDGIRMISGVQEATLGAQRSAEVSMPRLDGIRVLVAEDGPDNQQIIGFHLRQAGAAVTLAENGKVAVQLAVEAAARDRAFHLILMDMQMPLMDGYAATIALRNLRYTGPIIALTANAMAHDRQKCLTAGCSGFITKPIQWTAFWAPIRRLVTETGEAVARAGAFRLATDDDSTDVQELSAAAREELAQINAAFVAALPGRVSEIRMAFHRNDRIQMRFLAHALSGAAATFGFPEVSKLARQIDLNYNDEDVSRVADAIKLLDASVFRGLTARKDSTPQGSTSPGIPPLLSA